MNNPALGIVATPNGGHWTEGVCGANGRRKRLERLAEWRKARPRACAGKRSENSLLVSALQLAVFAGACSGKFVEEFVEGCR